MDQVHLTATRSAEESSWSATTVQGEDRETCSSDAESGCSQAVKVRCRRSLGFSLLASARLHK